MKNRDGFVSNSSSSSFIICGSNLTEVATAMFQLVEEDLEDTNDSKDYDKLQEICQFADVQSGERGIVFNSCNYDTYIRKEADKILISTSRNHDWDSCWPENANVTYSGIGEDSGREDICINDIGDGYFYVVAGDYPVIKKGLRDCEDGKLYKCPLCNSIYDYYYQGEDDKKYCPWHYVALTEYTPDSD